MQLHGSFGSAELRPVEHRRAPIDHRGIQAHQLVLKTESAVPADTAGSQGLALLQQLMINVAGPLLPDDLCGLFLRQLIESIATALTESAAVQREDVNTPAASCWANAFHTLRWRLH